MQKQFFCFTLACLFFMPGGKSQSSTEIVHELKKLTNPARVLYVAAHPDDENTRLISYLSNGAGAETAYLSLTRGDGGQNLIGNELGDKLGVLRTQELMQARAIDGGTQFFTRAVDFGYSKTATETFDKWRKEEVLADVVYVIRKFKPHIIITRFPPDKRAGHGHHTASALLAEEAFDLAGDARYQPQQLQSGLHTWQPDRLYWNTSTWWGLPLDSLARHSNDYLVMDVGGYDANLGKSYNELASLSRTQHKSQGFGVSIARGSQKEYLKYVKGKKALGDVFEGIPQNWAAYGAKEIDQELAEALHAFDFRQPEKSLEALLRLKKQAAAIEDDFQRNVFREKIKKILCMVSGLRAEALGARELVSEQDSLAFRLEILQRGTRPATLKKMTIADRTGRILWSEEVNQSLVNTLQQYTGKIYIHPGLSSQAYWLKKEYDALFRLEDPDNLGKPENDPVLYALFEVMIGDQRVEMQRPLRYKYSDRVEGEIEKPVAVVPPVLASISEENLVFTSATAQKLSVLFTNYGKQARIIELNAPGFILTPARVNLPAAEQRKEVQVTIEPRDSSSVAYLSMTYKEEGMGVPVMEMTELDYPHIDKRVVFNKARPKLVSFPLAKRGSKIAYLMGAGDKVPEAIRQMGYAVDVLDEEKVRTYDLHEYQAIVAGIRAYNTVDWLPSVNAILLEYMKNGGTYIVQYNTRSRDLLSTDIGPYPFSLSRKRVTEEDARAMFLLPDHEVLNSPNTLTEDDFKDWVQERGLYFADEWDEAYETPLAWHDEGEQDLPGGLLVADYGKGAFIYTGISFFRELPAGVPGAYRLLANLLSYTPKPRS